MSYLALYRKWRPKVFEEVVGQEHLTNTLINQIENNNFGHAYLFTGIRGTGKTTTAKIFSRAINCLDPQGHNPCNECEMCVSIINDNSMDIIEMDAASNNSVDDIRELRENVKFPPSKAKYKVYIIDEVHMLSKGAFNALLKTLEEPPEYVVFVLATTEPNKIPDTILSRCQRYDLKRVGNKKIKGRLSYVLDEMDLDFEDSALDLITSKAEGSVRDALSILDQCLSYHHEKLEYKDVIEILGLVEIEFLNDLFKSIINEDTDHAMELIDGLISSGKDITQFIDSIVLYFRNVMLFKLHSNPNSLISATDEEIEKMKKLSDEVDLNKIIRAINIFVELEKDIRYSKHDRILLEVALIKLFNPDYDLSNEGLVDRISKLENKVKDLKYGFRPDKDIKTDSNEKDEDIADDDSNAKEKDDEKYEKVDDIKQFVDSSTKDNFTLDNVLDEWSEVLSILKRVRIKVYAFIIESRPVKVVNDTIILKFDNDYKFHADNLMKSKNKDTVEEILKKVYSKNLQIEITMGELEKDDNKTSKPNDEDSIRDYFGGFDEKLEIKD